jgi:hypothetical protein
MILPDPPKASLSYLVADWLELAAAGDTDGWVAGDRLVLARKEVATRGGATTSPTKSDAWNREAEDVWTLLRARAEYYGSVYPFEVTEEPLELRTLRLDVNRLGYGFLLAAASLSAFETTKRHLLTGGFERASRHVMAALLPPHSTVSIFGTSSVAGERYGHGRLIDRLEALAADLATQLTHEARQEAAHGTARSSGDGGLDLVGWPEMVGPRKRLPVYFGQCACGKDWHHKPFEVVAASWDHRLEPVSPIVPVTFIPYAYRTEEQDWADLFAVIPTVLIDRPRWLQLLTRTGRLNQALDDMPTTWMLSELPGLMTAEEPDLE